MLTKDVEAAAAAMPPLKSVSAQKGVAKTGDTIMDLLLGLARERNKTLVVVTHDNNLAQRGDRTLHIVDGRLA